MSKDLQAYKSRMAAELLKSRDHVKVRSLSDHISSRWYRAPEVILLEKQYDQGIDMWAIGCILEEMIYCSEPYVQGMSQ
jgi:serine/threonine protein kinase